MKPAPCFGDLRHPLVHPVQPLNPVRGVYYVADAKVVIQVSEVEPYSRIVLPVKERVCLPPSLVETLFLRANNTKGLISVCEVSPFVLFLLCKQIKITWAKVHILADSRSYKTPKWMKRLQIIDSTTISLFSNLLFKGVGRHPKTGKQGFAKNQWVINPFYLFSVFIGQQ